MEVLIAVLVGLVVFWVVRWKQVKDNARRLELELLKKSQESLESSSLFDCDNGRHHWGLWEDVSSDGDIVQKRRCGECQKLEFSEVTKTPHTETLVADKIPATTYRMVKVSTALGPVYIRADKAKDAYVDTDGYLCLRIDVPKYGPTICKLSHVTREGALIWKHMKHGLLFETGQGSVRVDGEAMPEKKRGGKL